jgi:hypothetical protein
MPAATGLRPNLVRPGATHPKRRRNIIGMLAFGHAPNCKDAHLFQRIVGQASAISLHGRSFK